MRGACLFTCLFLSALGVPGTAQVRDRLTFDAASVKPNRTSDQAFLNLYRPGGHVLITNHTVRMLLANAFSMDLNRAGRQLVDLPSWADSDKLALHHEMRPQPVFVVALVNSGKLGPQLRAHTDDASCDQKASTGSAGVGATAAMPPEQAVWAAVQQLPCGRLGGGLLQERREQAWAGGRRVTMDVFAERLGEIAVMDRPVQANNTGLTGTFDLAFFFNPQIQDLAGSSPDAPGLSFTQALRDQLGLKLDPQTVPTDVIVIDHIEQPTED